MQWSKLKERVESMMAPALAERVRLHVARYRHAHDSEGRAWITIDGEEAHSFASIEYLTAQYKLASDLREANHVADWHDRSQIDGYREAGSAADKILARQGVLPLDEVYRTLERYLNTSVESTLVDESMLMRTLAVLDRRVGKRRLAALELRTDEHLLVRRCLELRCIVEGVDRTAAGAGRPLAH